MQISKDEIVIKGNRLDSKHRWKDEKVFERIYSLLENHLILVGRKGSGWQTLYKDPVDERLWELTYPASEMHGGGPPELNCVSKEYARNKYSIE